MNPETLADAKKLFAETKKASKKVKGTVIVAPPSVFLPIVAKKGLALAAQATHAEASGAYTGFISVPQVKDSGASYVIVGHAEQRARGVTDTEVAATVTLVVELGLIPIICIGESARDPHGEYLEVIKQQITTAVSGISKAKAKKILVAYEPVWKIGAEAPMTPHEMHETALYIKKVLVALFDKQGLATPVLYGGSITDESASAMMEHGDVQGLLVGRASVATERMHSLFSVLS